MNAVRARWRRRCTRGLLLACGLALVACAAVEPVRGEMHWGLDATPAVDRPVWPAPPETPRLRYSGALTGEANFRRVGEEPSRWRAFGRWLVGLDGRGEAPQVLQRPGAVTTDAAGRVYVSDASRAAVFVFDPVAGALQLWDRADPRLRFVAPAGLAVGAAGDLFVADAELGWVVHLDASGEPLPPVGRGQLQRPTGLARDATSGRLYVADTAAHDIKVFDAAGRLERTLGRRGSGPGEFNFPSHLAWAGGALYVSDTFNARIQILRPDEPGVAPRAFGARGLYVGNLVRPKGVAVDAEGHVYVVESYHDRLLVYADDGSFLLPVGGTGTAPGAFYLPAGAWIDAAQQVYVADMFNGRVLRFQYLADSGGGGG